ncbi:MAG TPA: hypothetical protein VKO18_09155 [Terriglobia bacterium]|nr:hypothetical protein [Terriglobia bacterium]
MIEKFLAVRSIKIIRWTPGSKPVGAAGSDVDFVQRLGRLEYLLANSHGWRKTSQNLRDGVPPYGSPECLDQSFHGFFSTLLGDERCPFVMPG